MKLNKVAEEIRELIAQRQQELGLTFEEEDHIYTMNGKKDYPSVSSVIKKFYKPFVNVFLHPKVIQKRHYKR
jgi:hypothetical protein